MITIKDKSECTGCGACENICLAGAIMVEYNDEGFLYPVIDQNKCNNCERCKTVCHKRESYMINNTSTPECFAGYLKDTEELSNVSSGGVFWALTQTILNQNEGIVVGVVHPSIFDVHHESARTLEDAKKFKRSKYLQSNTRKIYTEVKDALKNSETVLFSGTPCQIAGLYAFLGKEYEKLITCEVVCHGVPTMYGFKQYIKSLEEKYKSKVCEIVYRDKRNGWSNNHISIAFENGEELCERSAKNLFHSAYLAGLYSMPSCGRCRYAMLPRIADITLADYWKYEGTMKVGNKNRGISLIICSTYKGINLLDKAKKYLILEKSDLNAAVASCRHLTNSPRENSKRELFFTLINKNGYDYSVKKCMRQTVRKKLVNLLWRLKKIKKNRG